MHRAAHGLARICFGTRTEAYIFWSAAHGCGGATESPRELTLALHDHEDRIDDYSAL
jgi:hypothetical protein